MSSLPRGRIQIIPITTANVANLEQAALIDHKAVWSRKDDPDLTEFKHQLKEKLYELQNRRCCYCSVELQNNKKTYDLEHIIDKNRRYDLMFTIRNLANSCTLCNGAKSKKRVSLRRQTVGDPFPICSEEYWIVHPHYDEWNEHFEFDEFNRIIPKAASKKARYTYNLCRIDRLNIMRLADHFFKYNRSHVEALLRDIYRPANKKRQHQIDTLEKIAKTLKDSVTMQIFDIVKADLISLTQLPDKYVSPCSQYTWSGMGKRPNWVRAYVAAGGDIEELENN